MGISVITFIKKHSERLTLAGIGLAFLLFVGGGLYLQKKNKHVKEPLVESPPQTIELQVTQQDAGGETTPSAQKSSSYFLKPSPAELLNQLAAMSGLNENVSRAKFVGFRVMWPVYFFAIMDTRKNIVTVLFDVAEDGFGVEVQSEIDTTVYPEILKLTTGKKIWIAGEIIAVDPSGTGTVFMKLEDLRLKEDGSLPSESVEISPSRDNRRRLRHKS